MAAPTPEARARVQIDVMPARSGWADPLPFVHVAIGAGTLFQDARDPCPRLRGMFAVHRPQTLRAAPQVERANPGERAAGESNISRSPGAGLKFIGDYTVRHLASRTIDPAASAIFSILQRLHPALRRGDIAGEDFARSSLTAPADAAEQPVAYRPDIPPGTFNPGSGVQIPPGLPVSSGPISPVRWNGP